MDYGYVQKDGTSKDRETTACDFAHFIADRLKEFVNLSMCLGKTDLYISRELKNMLMPWSRILVNWVLVWMSIW